MRINRFIATATGVSRRKIDTAISQGQVSVNGKPASLGQIISDEDLVVYNGRELRLAQETHLQTIILNKPVGYVCSRNGQGNHTIYDLLPKGLHSLKPVGRLDKDSSGLLLLTNDGELAHQLTHPSFQKTKRYEITLDKPLDTVHQHMISDVGIQLNDGLSQLVLTQLSVQNKTTWKVSMHEGRNRQIRRTFAALGYSVIQLHRTNFGPYSLNTLPLGAYEQL